MENNTGVKRTRKSTPKVASYKFDNDMYQVSASIPEVVIKTAVDKRRRLVEVEVPTGRILNKLVMKADYDSHMMRCKYRAAKKYNVSIEHMESSYRKLNGKKIDGIYITDIIDRLGFSNGMQLNTGAIAKRYGHDYKMPIKIAEEKLYTIVNNADVFKAYADYVKDNKIEIDKVIRDRAVYGE